MQSEGGVIKMRNSQKGFSLIELLIVVAIILVIAAIAIPNLIRSQMAANEASAVTSLQTLNLAFVTYSATYGNALPPDLNSLRTPPAGTPPDCGTNGAGLVDNVLAGVTAGGGPATFTKDGYTFTFVGTNPLTAPPDGVGCTAPGFNNVQTTAIPVSIGGTGQRGFLIDETAVIYYTTDGSAPIPGTSPILP
jgi:prepilin-type N-terminal cleavage/methylation domain-containing protein